MVGDGGRGAGCDLARRWMCKVDYQGKEVGREEEGVSEKREEGEEVRKREEEVERTEKEGMERNAGKRRRERKDMNDI